MINIGLSYIFSIENDIESNKVNSSRLVKEIRESNIVSNLDYITTELDVLTVKFKAALSPSDSDILTALIGSHDGTPLLGAQHTQDGLPIFAPAFEYSNGLDPVWKGYQYTAESGIQNIFDERITTEIQVRGGWYQIIDPTTTLGDLIEFAIVDKDNVLGLFDDFNLTSGDVLELKKYVIQEYVHPTLRQREVFQVDGSYTVMSGLYFRTIYINTGAEDVDFKSVIMWYE